MRLVFNLVAPMAVVLFPMSAKAQSGCSEPRAPYCLTGFTTFEDEYSFNSCRSELETYQDEVQDFSQCLADEVQDLVDEAESKTDVAAAARREADDATSEAQDADREAIAASARAVEAYEDAVEYWNCKAADPDGFCPGP
ncbi:MAG: hypothetical protein V4712_15130 [Pseudomonadota bacterium]